MSDFLDWASDVAISMPVPPSGPVLAELGGFGFTLGGIAHNLTEGDVDALGTPFFAPEGINPR